MNLPKQTQKNLAAKRLRLFSAASVSRNPAVTFNSGRIPHPSFASGYFTIFTPPSGVYSLFERNSVLAKAEYYWV